MHGHAPALPPVDYRPDHPPPLPVEPYSITTISHGNPNIVRFPPESRSSDGPVPSSKNSIPPPAIIRGKQPLPGVNSNGISGGSGIYYSMPTEMMEQIKYRGATRVLNDEGVFVTQDAQYTSQSSLESGSQAAVQPRLGESTFDSVRGRPPWR